MVSQHHEAELSVSGCIFRGTAEPIMATLGGSRGDRLGSSNHNKSAIVSPEKVREILNEGVSSTGVGSNRCDFFNQRALIVQFKKTENKLTLASLPSHLAW